MRPWLSVIVPTFNGEALVGRALDSVVAEGDASIEVIAIDDGSTDGTVAVLESYRPLLNLTIERRRVGNWVSNSNLGIDRASADLVCFLHQDDSWLPGRLAAVRKQLPETPSAGLLLHACLFVTSGGRAVGAWRCPLPPGLALAPAHAVEHLLVQNFIGIAGGVFRRSLALECGGMDDALWYTADWDFWLKMAAATATVYVPDPLATFRVHAGSQTATRSRSLDDFRQQLQTVYERHSPRWAAPDAATRAAVERAARAAIEVNIALAAAYHRSPIDRSRLFSALLALRAPEWRRFWRDSRLGERVTARLRAGFR